MLVECRTCTHSDDVRLTGRAQMSPAYIILPSPGRKFFGPFRPSWWPKRSFVASDPFRVSLPVSASSLGHSVQRRRTFPFLSDHTPLRQLLRDRAASLVGPGFTICWVPAQSLKAALRHLHALRCGVRFRLYAAQRQASGGLVLLLVQLELAWPRLDGEFSAGQQRSTALVRSGSSIYWDVFRCMASEPNRYEISSVGACQSCRCLGGRWSA